AVLAQQLEGEPVALVDELAALAVDELGGGLAVAGEAAACLVGAGEVGVLSGGEGEGADAFVHAPAGDHLGGEARDLLEVVLGAGGAVAVDELFGGAAAEGADDAGAEVGLGVVVAVVVGALVGDAQGLAAGGDGDAGDGVGFGDDEAQQGVAGLVVGDAFAVLGGEREGALRAQDHLLEGLGEVAVRDGVAATAGGLQGGLVDQVAEVGADEAGGDAGDAGEAHGGVEGQVAGVDLEDLLAPVAVGGVDGDATVEAAGAEEGGVEDVWAVGGGQHDDALARAEAVHLGEDLVEGLFLLAVAAEDGGAAGAADGVELVDEDDGGGGLAGLLEEVADAAGADADDHLDELGGVHAEEGHAGLAGDGFGEEGLAGAGSADEEDALRGGAAEAGVLLGVLEEVDDLGELGFGFVDAGDV